MINSIMNFYKERKDKWYMNYYVLFALVFILCSLIIFSPFFIEGKTFIWKHYGADGLVQHYASQVYFGNYIREIVKNLITNHELIIPMWDTTIGLGLDVFTSLNVYAIGDPLNLLYIFTPEKYGVHVYNILVLVRILLSGFAFSKYCFTMKQNKLPTFIGSFIYMFCGYAIFTCVRHPFFINPMIYLPIILIGVEYILKGKKPYLFIGMIALASIVHFYFFYMLTIATILYALVRVLYIYNDREPFKKVAHYFIKFSKYYLLAMLFAAVLFVPILLGFFSCSRISTGLDINLLFREASFYYNFVKCFFTNTSSGNWTNVNFSVLSILAVLCVFKGKTKKDKFLKWIFLISFIAVVVPLFAYVMNGFMYAQNRWIFIFSFIVSFITVYAFNDIFCFVKKNKRILLIIFSLFVFLNCIVFYTDHVRLQVTMINSYIIILPLLMILVLLLSKKVSKKSFNFLIIMLAFIQILTSGFLEYSHLGKNYVDQFLETSRLSEYTNTKELRYIKKTDSDLYRIDQYDIFSVNYGHLNNVNGVSSFYSILRKELIDYCLETDNIVNLRLSSIKDYDKRIVTNTLLGVKYIVTANDRHIDMPAQYQKIKTYKDTTIYKNKASLPLFYTYDSYIPSEAYLNLSGQDKEYALLQGVVINSKLDDNLSINLKEKKPKINSIKTMNLNEFKKTAKYDNKKIVVQENAIVVKKRNSTIELDLNGSKESECYLSIKSLDFSYKKAKKVKTKPNTSNTMKKFAKKIESKKISSLITLTLDDDTHIKSCSLPSRKNSYYLGPLNHLFNLGYYDNPNNHKVTLTFQETGNYSFEDISIISKPVKTYEKYIDKLKEDDLKQLDINANDINIKINTDKEKIGVLAVPYSKGWKAYVNGKETEVLQANTQFMGVKLQKGENNITFKYSTPGLKLGAIISSIAIILSVLYNFFFRKKKLSKKITTS